MTDVNDISEEVLIQSIREIVETADLNVMTPKLVRTELKTKLNVQDLDKRKKEINAMIGEVIVDLSKRNQKKNKNKEIKVKTEDREGSDTPPNDPKTQSNESEDKKKTKPKESDVKSEDNSSSDDEIEDKERDEELARKLHNEELSSKRRVTRNENKSSKRKRSDKKKTKSKNKSHSDEDSDEEKPQKKKRKNGYLRPCALSTDLADFLGEPEMARHEVVKRIWSYVKEKNLLDPKNKQFAICDNPLIKIFGRKRVRMFGMMKFLAKHLN